MAKEITSTSEDFNKWYTDVIKKAELVDYSCVRGCVILRPYGFAIWENITGVVDKLLKKIGVENVSMPLLIPESLLRQEKDHIEGFNVEAAWVTCGGGKELSERLCVRPTSEVLFCSHFSQIIESWRDLPKLYNQWCSVVRWEKTSRPFLRSVEFHWQEGHTIHSEHEEAREFTITILNLYADFFRETLCIPFILGKKTEKEKFAGAKETYTVECMMKDGKALQSATSHFFGSKFAEVFEINFRDKNNAEKLVSQTSWGLSTRVIAAIIMVHGDDDGLVLPPKIAPIQIVIIPIFPKREEILKKSNEVFENLKNLFRIKFDASDHTPGWKFAEYEVKGVPIRIEIGPKDVLNDECVLVRRDTREKKKCFIKDLKKNLDTMFEDINKNLYLKALKNMESRIFKANSWNEMVDLLGYGGFIKTLWCGAPVCEEKVKNELGLSSRCMPLKNKITEGVCPVCGKEAITEIFWGKSY
ncbi:MAG: proline--tRNA ligase [Oscillospiraceae bacterium]|nr:proline--tRNA ligase [Oscillospiraceae bacterium]